MADALAHPDSPGTEVEVHSTPAHVVRYNPDAPSEEWGWHGDWRLFAPVGSRILLWLGVLGMFLFLLGNHVSHVENWWLAAIGTLMALWLLRGEVKIRQARRRKP